jgi:hypothetical protein
VFPRAQTAAKLLTNFVPLTRDRPCFIGRIRTAVYISAELLPSFLTLHHTASSLLLIPFLTLPSGPSLPQPSLLHFN